MGAFDDTISRMVAGAGDSFLEEYAKETINDCLRWSEFAGTKPEALLDQVCQFRLLERHRGEKLLMREFCKCDFADIGAEIVQDFGAEDAKLLRKAAGVLTSRDENDMDFLAAFIISESLPESNRVAEYVAGKIRERKDWKLCVRAAERRDE